MAVVTHPPTAAPVAEGPTHDHQPPRGPAPHGQASVLAGSMAVKGVMESPSGLLLGLPPALAHTVLARLSPPDLAACGAACASLQRLMRSETFLHFYYAEHHAAEQPGVPWPCAALAWRPLRPRRAADLAAWLAAHAELRARATPHGPDAAALAAAAPALAAGDVCGALLALCPDARRMLLAHAAHAGRDDVVTLLLVRTADLVVPLDAPPRAPAGDAAAAAGGGAALGPEHHQQQQQQQQPPPPAAAAAEPSADSVSMRLDTLDLAMRAALVGRRAGALAALRAHAAERARRASDAAAGGAQQLLAPPPPPPALVDHAVACSDLACLRALCEPLPEGDAQVRRV